MYWSKEERELSSKFREKGLILVKGNPQIPNATNGYSLLNEDRECVWTELSWFDCLKKL